MPQITDCNPGPIQYSGNIAIDFIASLLHLQI